MRAIWMMKHGRDAFLVRETPDPIPRAGEIRIRIQACSLNFADLVARNGFYPAAPKPPGILGYEASGTIDCIGEGVSDLSAGDRVVAMTSFGGHSDTVCTPETAALKIPDEMSFEDAAALPVNYLTADCILSRIAHAQPGETVLVHGAAGGVGLAILQLCRNIGGLRVIGTASAAKHDALRQNGCEFPIDYRNLDYVAEVKRMTGGAGVDIVCDPLGGSDSRKCYAMLRPGGRLVSYGFSNLITGARRNWLRILTQLLIMPRFSPLKLMTDNRTVAGVSLASSWGAPLRADLKRLIDLSRDGKIRPLIDGSYSFSQISEAVRRLEERKNVGKIILRAI